MRLLLKLHPDYDCDAVARIEVDVSRPSPEGLELRYRATGDTSKISLFSPAAPVRADQLWEHTCFEAFVRAGSEAPYYEFNFAPSLEWAAYRFAGHRRGMSTPNIDPPQVLTHRAVDRYELEASLRLAALADLPNDVPWQLNLTAVIEEKSGRKSYWALAHPAGKADFHHPDCFTHQLQATQ
jgi:hypothetical protein